MVKLNHSLASVSNALNHQIGSLHVIEDGIIQLDKTMGTTRIFSQKSLVQGHSLHLLSILIYLTSNICLRSRPVDPDVVRPSVSQSVSQSQR